MESIPELKFSCNWNGKLFCSTFSTIRNRSIFYKEAEIYNVMFKEKCLGTAQIIRIVPITGKQITQTMALLDTGYTLGETLGILAKMNHITIQQIDDHEFFYIILKRLHYKIPDIFSINNI
jgi:hypothetical protein